MLSVALFSGGLKDGPHESKVNTLPKGKITLTVQAQPGLCPCSSWSTRIAALMAIYIYICVPTLIPYQQEASHLGQSLWTVQSGHTPSLRKSGPLRHQPPSMASAFQGYRALQRRGLAYDLIGVLSFRVHERWLQKAFAHMSTPAPPGYNRPSLQQVLRADRALWLELASRQPQLTRSAANAPAADARCLDKAFEEASSTMDVNFHFMPLVHAPQQLHDKGGHGGRRKRWGDGKGSQWTHQEKWQRTDKGKGGGKPAFKGKDDGKGKGNSSKTPFINMSLDYRSNRNTTPMPAGLRGGVPADDNGEAICFGFGLGQCKEAPVGGRCPKGRHVCCFPGCFGKHPFIEHKNKAPKA